VPTRPPLSSSIRSAAGAGAVLLIAGCAAAIMAITDAKRSKAVQRCIPDSIFLPLQTSRHSTTIRIPYDFDQ
jgi:hypothetical protein